MSAVLETQPLVTEIVPYNPSYRNQVMELARQMQSESVVHRHVMLNETKLDAQLMASQTAPDTVFFKLAVRAGEVLGGFLGVITTLYFSDERAASDRAWFVKKDRRGSVAAVLLLQAFEEWGKAHGVQMFMLGQSTGVQIETTKMLYEKLGYTTVGFNTFKRL